MNNELTAEAFLPYAQYFFEMGMVEIPFPKVERLIWNATVGFWYFLELPEEDKAACSFPNKVGWHRRNDRERKEFVHVTETLQILANERRLPHLQAFCSTTMPLLQQCKEVLLVFLEAVGILDPTLCWYQKVSDERSGGEQVLRLLYYPPTQQRILAYNHTDTGLLTFHLTDSRPGLHLEGREGVYRPRLGHVLVFPGDQAGKLSFLTPVRHSVVQDPDDPLSNLARISMVFFGGIGKALMQ